jgi:hypothetical protein
MLPGGRRSRPEAMKVNQALVDSLGGIAKKKNAGASIVSGASGKRATVGSER